MNLNDIVNNNNDLYKIGSKFGTDKIHSGGPINSYLNVMNFYFSSKRYDSINILEIGVRESPSVLTWQEFFPNAKIYGLDIDDCTKHNNDRIKVIVGDQTNISDLERISNNVDFFDIIIDDGSHINKDIIFSFNYLFNKLRPGGIYIIEDLSNSYPAFTCGQNKITVNKREDIQSFFNEILFEIDKSSWGEQSRYLFIHFFSSICVIGKSF